MRDALILTAAAAALLAGCGEDSGKAASASFDRRFLASCIDAASKNVPAAIARQACQCTIDATNRQYSTAEKLAVSIEKLKPLMMGCIADMAKQH